MCLKDALQNKYIICDCEGNAEQAIMDLLIDEERLLFCRADLMGGKCTQLRAGTRIAREFFHVETEREIAILRILDRPKEKLFLPRVVSMRDDIYVIDIVTKPEIEILHIVADGFWQDFIRRNPRVKPSAYYQERIHAKRTRTNIKARDFIMQKYQSDVDRLVDAIRQSARLSPGDGYCLADLLRA